MLGHGERVERRKANGGHAERPGEASRAFVLPLYSTLPMVDLASLLTLHRTKPREQFIAALPHSFLVLSTSGEGAPIHFETVVAPVRANAKTIPADALGIDVLEIVKAKGNPYPDRISVGRARNCDLVLRDASVSKLHAHFRVVAVGKLALVDMGSQNGSRVNGQLLAAGQPQPVSSGDAILIGRVPTKLVDAAGLYETFRLLGSVGASLDEE